MPNLSKFSSLLTPDLITPMLSVAVVLILRKKWAVETNGQKTYLTEMAGSEILKCHKVTFS
ncbi:MAG: hypothetical protein F6K22_20880 [Okeania sp. SIO2F4]|uniref:hypothetical protein n=1 Tax=Okeania sp. SIO2F4 TaxID=2607790 RepID=UPI00142932DB|nr:hypothetical protein [Okeania sp. SIO2F4]NES05063.1 hypothetical protein [Okeania sp. SIO2F4]